MIKQLCLAFSILFLPVIVGNKNQFCLIELQAWGGDDILDEQYGYIDVNGTRYLYSNLTFSAKYRGVNTMIVDMRTCQASVLLHFDTYMYQSSALNLAVYLNSLTIGTIILGLTFDDPTDNLGPALQTLEEAGVSVADVNFRGKFAFIIEKGVPEKTVLRKSNSSGNRTGRALQLVVVHTECVRPAVHISNMILIAIIVSAVVLVVSSVSFCICYFKCRKQALGDEVPNSMKIPSFTSSAHNYQELNSPTESPSYTELTHGGGRGKATPFHKRNTEHEYLCNRDSDTLYENGSTKKGKAGKK